MRLVFFGTSEFAVPSLTALHEAGFPPMTAVTRPDRPRGRGLQLAPPPVKNAAARFGLAVEQPETLKEFLPALRALAPDLIVTVAYGKILPPSILDLPPRGCVNLHPSLLPKYRGASPIEGALMAGESETGVTTYFMDAGLDSGEIILQRRVPIVPAETGGELAARLAVEGGALLVETVRLLKEGIAPRVSQDHAAHTMTRPIQDEDCLIHWEWPASRIVNLVRALAPRIGAYTRFRGKRLKIWRAEGKEWNGERAPGTIVGVDARGICVRSDGGDEVALLEVQLEGRERIGAVEFARGARIQEGELLGG